MSHKCLDRPVSVGKSWISLVEPAPDSIRASTEPSGKIVGEPIIPCCSLIFEGVHVAA